MVFRLQTKLASQCFTPLGRHCKRPAVEVLDYPFAAQGHLQKSAAKSTGKIALRRTGQLSISLVAAEHDEILGHVAISPVSISSGVTGWYGLGPISVRPDRQGKGIGSALMWAALQQLRQQGAAGCVVLGDPAYYGRFGFKAHPGLELPDVPPEYFQALSFTGELPVGVVKYAAAFDARE